MTANYAKIELVNKRTIMNKFGGKFALCYRNDQEV